MPTPPRNYQRPTRDHWLNTIIGVLDSSFYLTPEEQFGATSIVNRLLEALNIPDRALPVVLPMPLVQEMHANFYSTALESSLSGFARPARPVVDEDCVTSLESWRSAIESMFTSAYPDLTPQERVILAKVVSDLLAAIGVPNRAASFFPDMVMLAHRDLADH